MNTSKYKKLNCEMTIDSVAEEIIFIEKKLLASEMQNRFKLLKYHAQLKHKLEELQKDSNPQRHNIESTN